MEKAFKEVNLHSSQKPVKTASVKWYKYIDFENNHCIELQFINNLTGGEFWKLYKNKNYSTVYRIAKAQQSKFFKKIAAAGYEILN